MATGARARARQTARDDHFDRAMTEIKEARESLEGARVRLTRAVESMMKARRQLKKGRDV